MYASQVKQMFDGRFAQKMASIAFIEFLRRPKWQKHQQMHQVRLVILLGEAGVIVLQLKDQLMHQANLVIPLVVVAEITHQKENKKLGGVTFK
jgi:hypothetical protein